ncbi:hypothetical protein FOZ62_002140, partial [Perkinsus olseni]
PPDGHPRIRDKWCEYMRSRNKAVVLSSHGILEAAQRHKAGPQTSVKTSPSLGKHPSGLYSARKKGSTLSIMLLSGKA